MFSFSSKKEGGYALYTAIIITGLLIIVAYATANIAIQQLALTGSAADSHIAFYNADAGLECAEYADLKNGAVSSFDNSVAGSVVCNGQTITTGSQTVQTVPTQSSKIGGGGIGSTSIFQLNFTQGCAIVQVTKTASTPQTTISSKGYNSCTGSNRLERGITVQY